MTGKTELKGVGGWLAFLVFSMAVLSPARTLLGYYHDIVLAAQGRGLAGNPVWETYTTIVLVLVIASCLLFFLAAYRLCRERVWRSVRFAIIAMWVACAGMDAIGLAALYFVFGGEFAAVVWQSGMGAVIKGLAYPALWTAYLLKSRRVRNTYRRETEMEELAGYLGVGKK